MTGIIAKEQLLQYIQRIERLEEERAGVMEGIKEVFDEARAVGFDVKAMKQVLKLKKLDRGKLAEQEAILDLYRQALDL